MVLPFPIVSFLTPLNVYFTSGGLRPRKERTTNAGGEVGREDLCSLLMTMLTVWTLRKTSLEASGDAINKTTI